MLKSISMGKWTITIIILTVFVAVLAPLTPQEYKYLLLIVALLVYGGCFISITSISNEYNQRAQSLSGLISLYMDCIILYASIYFYASIIDGDKSKLITGVTNVCMQASCFKDLYSQLDSIAEAFFGCLYLSILNMTTSSDSNIGIAGSWGRVIFVCQLFTTMYITVIGLSNLFNKQSGEELQKMKCEIIMAIKTNKDNANKIKIQKPLKWWDRLIQMFA